MDALDTLSKRRSSRSFLGKPVPKDIIEKIVNAGRLAATARNIQPWQFVVITNPEMNKKVAALTDHGKFIAQAPVCVAVFCEDTKYYLEDGSAATQNMLLAACALGVQSCWVAGDKKVYAPQIGALLGVPEKMKLVSLIPLGYEDKPTSPPSKRPLESLCHWEKY